MGSFLDQLFPDSPRLGLPTDAGPVLPFGANQLTGVLPGPVLPFGPPTATGTDGGTILPFPRTQAEAAAAAQKAKAEKAAAAAPKAAPSANGGASANAVLGSGIPQQYASVVHSAAQETGVDPYLLAGLLQQESQWNPQALSKAGAQGLGQLMPDTARGLGVADPWNPEQNIRGSARYLAQQIRAFGNDPVKALAAYNAGPGAVQQYGGVPPYQETQNYVRLVQQYADQYRQRANTVQPWTAPTVAAASNTYVFPVQGYTGQVQPHHGSVKGGSDIFAPEGTPVVAMRGGQVLRAGFDRTGGNTVLIQGDDGNQYYYAHLRDLPLVQQGQPVGPGTPLGAVGETGNARGTGAHLHFGMGPSIVNGAGPYGGTGGDFDALALLQQALAAIAR